MEISDLIRLAADLAATNLKNRRIVPVDESRAEITDDAVDAVPINQYIKPNKHDAV